MKKIQFNKVTWYSRMLSILFFVLVVPILTFCIGREYQKTLYTFEKENESFLASIVSYADRELRAYDEKATSGIRGVVTVGPNCPAVQAENEAECADKPLSTKINFINKYGAITTVTSEENGVFVADLPPGAYIIVQGKPGLPSLAEKTVVVSENEYEVVDLSFDSGIR